MGITARWVTVGVVLSSSVQVYAQEFQQIAANGVSQFGQFGATLRVDDNTLIVGSLWDDQRGSNAGAAFVFSRAPGELWAQEAKLTAGDASQAASFGSAVDVSGNFAVIGASGVNGRTGAAYVFERVNGSWVQRSKMLPSGNEARSVFGASVAINGDWAVIGAPDHFRNSGPGRTGAIYVYQRNGSSWGLQAKIYANDGQSVNYFGSSVDILDNRIVVGATGINSLGGSVYVFRRDGSTWVQEQKITPGDERPGDAFGWAVSLSGIRLAVGSPNDDVASINQGAVRIYKRSGNKWSLEATVTSAGHQTSEHFGFSVHLNDPELLIGAPGDAGGQGSAYFFDRDETGRWRQQVKYVPPISDRRAAFGRAVGLGGQDILIGASSADGGAVRSGTVFSLGGGGAFRQGFQDMALNLPGLSNPHIEWADADGDGDLDLALSGNSNGNPQIHLYRNDGDKGFKIQTTGLRNPSDGALSWADLNNDGAMDLIASGDFDGVLETRFYVNDGSGSFTESDSTTIGFRNGRFAWGDYDNDGDADLLAGGVFDVGWRINLIRNDGGFHFHLERTLFEPLEDLSFDWGDYDNDGRLDLILSGMKSDGTPATLLYKNTGGNFTEVPSGVAGVNGIVQFVDYSSDGQLDVFECGEFADGYGARLYRNTGGAFVPADNIELPQITGCSSSWGDYDNDGDVDLLLSGSGAADVVTDVYENTDDGTFEGARFELAHVSHGSVEWVDFDRDGRLDIALAGAAEKGNEAFLYKNVVGFSQNQRPSRPQNLRAEFTGRDVILHWDGASDDKTPTSALTYNVRIGTAPGSIDVMSPLTNRSGFRTLNRRGNVGHTLQFRLDTPTDGRYYWSVQTVDHAFAVSQFAPEAVFMVGQHTSDFVDVDASLLGYRAGSTDWIDLNEDGYLDVFLTGAGDSGPQASIYYYDPDLRSYKLGETNVAAVMSSGTAWGDYDNDGDLDLALIGIQGDKAVSKIYRNDGLGSMTDISAPLPPVMDGAVAWSDLDNDGDLDLVLSGMGQNGPVTSVFVNEHRDVFSALQVNLLPMSRSAIAIGDYDGDLDNDILLAGYDGFSPRTVLYRNEDFPRFAEAPINVPGFMDGDAGWGDFDGDGDIDLAVTGTTIAGAMTKIYQNQRNGILSDVGAPLPSLQRGSITWADFDGNGKLDVLVSGSGASRNETAVFRYMNRDEGFQRLPIADLPQIESGHAVPGDYDGDGRLDVLVSGQGGFFSTARVIRNQVPLWENMRPSAPSELSHRYDGNKLYLFWEASQDAETSSSGLTYDLRVSTTENGSDIMSPGTRPDGTRIIVGPGNVGLNTRWVIDNPPPGRIVWSVHAIDGGFRASRRSEVDVLRIGETVSDYVEMDPGFAGVSYSDADFVDIDGDQDLDVSLFGVSGGAQIGALYENDGTGQFQRLTVELPAVSHGDAVWGDYDKDGDPDLFLTGEGENGRMAAILRNDSATVFTELPLDLEGVEFSYSSWVDVDGDGDLDIAYGGETVDGFLLKVLLNEGDDTFVEEATNLPALTHGSMDWTDLDHDGDADLLLTGSDGIFPRSTVFRNDGLGSFTALNVDLTAVFDGTGDWVDIDGDGDADIALTGNAFAGPTTNIYLNSGGTFTLISDQLPGVRVSSTAWTDIDGDGDLDLAIAGWDGLARQTRIYANNGAGFFSEVYTTLRGVSVGSLSWGDADSDGDPDLLVTGASDESPVTRLYLYGPGETSGGPPSGKITTAVSDVQTDDAFPLPADGYLFRTAYPSPFAESATVPFAVGSLQKVDVSLYNILGQRVARLYSGTVRPNEMKSAVIDARKLSSGAYVVRIEGERFSKTQSIIVNR